MPKPHSRSRDRAAAAVSAAGPQPSNRAVSITTTHELSLKQLLKSSDTLLKPPSPLSSNPPDLIQRLRQCSKTLPKDWRRRTPEWNDEDELDQIGDNGLPGGDGVDEQRRKRRRDELVFVVGKRCFALIKSMQVVLEKECWPKDQRGGLDQNECRSNRTLLPTRSPSTSDQRIKKNKRTDALLSRKDVPSPPPYSHHHHPHPHPHIPLKLHSKKSQPAQQGKGETRYPRQENASPRSSVKICHIQENKIKKIKYANRKVSSTAAYTHHPSSVLLGTADLRLIRLMLQHTTFSYLLPLTAQYADALPNISQETSSALSTALESSLKLLKTSGPPTPAAGPSSRAPTPPTVITQTLSTSHLIPIFLSTLILAYTPSIPSEQHAPLRSAFMQSLLSLSPGHAISSLVNVLKLLVSGRKEGAKINGWVREWPKYPEGIINGLLTAQVRRPGGVRGLMENVLGETAKTDDVASIDGKRLDHIFNVLVRIPRQVTPEIYYPWLLSELFSMIPLTDSSHHHPIAYVNTACYCIQRLWASNRPLIGEWLKSKLHSPWYPKLPATIPSNERPIVVTTWEHCQRSVQNMRLLIIHNPTSPEFANFIVGTILPPLFSLYAFVDEQDKKLQSITIAPRSGKATSAAGKGSQLKEDVLSVLRSWGTAVDQAEGVKGFWSIVEGGQGWGRGGRGDEVELYWEKEGEGVRLMARSQSHHGEQTQITLPTFSGIRDTSASELLGLLPEEQRASPDPTLFCHLIRSIDRPEIASEVILKSLDLWRIKLATESEPSTESLLNLQLTIKMMELLGAQLFTKPDQVLGFVERVLKDQVESSEQGEQHPQSTDGMQNKPLIVEVGGKGDGHSYGGQGMDDDAAPDGKRGLIEVACQLLASLEADGQLDSSDLTIVHPILAHLEVLATRSPSVSIRNASREARLLLLSHQSATTPLRDLSSPAKVSAETYQQAMKFVADPIIPVRAHGLAMLRDLVFAPSFDKQLIPQILAVFMRQIDSSDSFIYLTAIKGLCGMVDKLGKEIFEVLMHTYRQSTMQCFSGELENRIDRSLRLAEAMDQVIERTGEASHQYTVILLPSLMDIYPNSQLPTIIRSSALSLISTLARVAPLSILFDTNAIADAVLDLIQIETVASSPFRPILTESEDANNDIGEKPKAWGKSKKIQLVDDEPDPEPEEPREDEASRRVPAKPRTVDAEPTKANDGTHPTLRRAALTLLGWVIRVLLFVSFADNDDAEEFDDEREFKLRLPPVTQPILSAQASAQRNIDELNNSDSNSFHLPSKTIERAVTILVYLIRTDEDEVTRQHAESVVADLKLLQAGTETALGGVRQALQETELPSNVERKLQAMTIV
ncbi:hypothetical protein I316_07314 [Kwoniella heveanensis BCC8398]|uniref:Uncharacterized protein n=1 Tax=Kwoniella heveanensis BCC8398 TaxID=1296120 RepID=A0A1B9GJ54_9TREE|nr:hypothetical protein I316_07314 [Kwoniella heveanensis BCC8398]